MNSKSMQWVIKPQTPAAVYTDRQEFIDHFYMLALEAIRRRTMSTVLLGQRRMGKTEIFKHTINRLFFEQDPDDPNVVIPVYFAFPEEIVDRWEFSISYVETFIRWYMAFRLHDPDIISEKKIQRDQLVPFIEDHISITEGFSRAINIFQWLQLKDVTIPELSALTTPCEVADVDDITVAMFVDEFQNTHLPQYNFRVVGFMQTAVESINCPYFVTGSAMGMLKDILGRGALFGRFMSHPIEALTDYYGAELAMRSANFYGALLLQEMAPVVSERCGGNPFYITAVVRQAAAQRKTLDCEKALNEMLAVDLSSGFIWAELHDQVTRWIARLNDIGITKWILYLAAIEDAPRIDLKRIQKELVRQEGKMVELEMIKDVLVKLSRGDLLDYKEFGGWFSKLKDPILEEFLKVWGRIEVKGEDREKVQNETVTKYVSLRKKISEYKGYLAEVYMIQILWNSQRKTLPGKYFHNASDIEMPDRFFYIDHRRRMGIGRNVEIDIYAAAGLDVWIAESKFWQEQKVGSDVVKRLIEQIHAVKTKKEDIELQVRAWLFAYKGVTQPAQELLRKHRILWSARTDLDALLTHVKLRPLPKF